MSACEPWSYIDITPDVFERLREAARKEGCHIPSASAGEFILARGGVTLVFHYAWQASGCALQLTCVKKPLLVSCAMVKSYADQIVQQSGGTCT